LVQVLLVSIRPFFIHSHTITLLQATSTSASTLFLGKRWPSSLNLFHIPGGFNFLHDHYCRSRCSDERNQLGIRDALGLVQQDVFGSPQSAEMVGNGLLFFHWCGWSIGLSLVHCQHQYHTRTTQTLAARVMLNAHFRRKPDQHSGHTSCQMLIHHMQHSHSPLSVS